MSARLLTAGEKKTIKDWAFSLYPEYTPSRVQIKGDIQCSEVFLHLTTNANGSRFFQKISVGVAWDILKTVPIGSH